MASKIAHNWPKPFFTVQPSPQPRIDFSYYRLVPTLICLLICAISPSQCNQISLTFHEKNIFGQKTFRVSFIFFYKLSYIRVMHSFFNQTKMQGLILHSTGQDSSQFFLKICCNFWVAKVVFSAKVNDKSRIKNWSGFFQFCVKNQKNDQINNTFERFIPFW